MFWIIVIAAVIIFFILKSDSYDAARIRNGVKSYFVGEQGLCRECKHCVRDESRRFSDSEWVCRLSKCTHITEDTMMDCFEKPRVTEDDLNELFALGIWNDAGKRYLREMLLGKEMTFSELDAFLRELPKQYPHFIDPEYIQRNQ